MKTRTSLKAVGLPNFAFKFPLSPLFAAGVIAFFAVVILAFAGGSVRTAASSVAILVLATFASGPLLKIAGRGKVWTFGEFLGLSLPLAAVIIIALSQLCRDSSLSVVILLCVGGLGMIFRPAIAPLNDRQWGSWQRVIALCVVLFPTSIFLLSTWRRWPINAISPWFLNTDAGTHESMATSLTLWGPGRNLAVSGSGIRYNWFADAFVGKIAQISEAAPYFTLSRTLYLFTFLTVAILAWAIAGQFKRNPWIQSAAVFSAFSASTLPVALSHAGGLVFEPFSPSVQFGLVFYLALTLVVVIIIKDGRWPLIFFTLVFAFGVTGSRAAFGLLAAATSFLMLLFTIRSKRFRRIVAAISAAVLLGVVFAAIILALPRSLTSASDNWVLKFNTDLVESLGLVPFNNQVGMLLALIVTCITFCFGSAAGFTLRLNCVGRWLAFWTTATLLFGLVGVFCSSQPGYSQFSLIAPGLVLSFLFGGIGVGNCLSGIRHRTTPKYAVLVFGTIAISIVIAVVVELAWPMITGIRFEGLIRTTTPVAILISIGLCLTMLVKFLHLSFRQHLPIFAVGISVCAMGMSCAAIVFGMGHAQREANLYQQSTLSSQEIEAGLWARIHTSPSALFASNRSCTLPRDEGPYCVSMSFPISTLAQRQALIEGQTYGVSLDLNLDRFKYPWAVERLSVSEDFSHNPDEESRTRLWGMGVRYFWIDNLHPSAHSWIPFAEPVFQNSRITILSLNPPE